VGDGQKAVLEPRKQGFGKPVDPLRSYALKHSMPGWRRRSDEGAFGKAGLGTAGNPIPTGRQFN